MGKATKKLTKTRIIKTLRSHKHEIKKFSVKKIGLFGSYLKGGCTMRSDLDFLVVFDKTTFDNYIELKFTLERIFGKKVDLVIVDDLKPSLQYLKEDALYV